MSNRHNNRMPPVPAPKDEVEEVSSLEPALNEEMPMLKKSMESETFPEPKEEIPGPVKLPKGIEVVALRPGLYKKYRRDVGHKFMVDKFEQLGSWMKCVDPVMQKKHEQVLVQRRAIRRKVGQEPNAGE